MSENPLYADLKGVGTEADVLLDTAFKYPKENGCLGFPEDGTDGAHQSPLVYFAHKF